MGISTIWVDSGGVETFVDILIFISSDIGVRIKVNLVLAMSVGLSDLHLSRLDDLSESVIVDLHHAYSIVRLAKHTAISDPLERRTVL